MPDDRSLQRIASAGTLVDRAPLPLCRGHRTASLARMRMLASPLSSSYSRSRPLIMRMQHLLPLALLLALCFASHVAPVAAEEQLTVLQVRAKQQAPAARVPAATVCTPLTLHCSSSCEPEAKLDLCVWRWPESLLQTRQSMLRVTSLLPSHHLSPHALSYASPAAVTAAGAVRPAELPRIDRRACDLS